MPPRPGAFAGLVRVPERNVVVIPDEMPFAHAALVEPVAVSWHAVRIGVERLHQPLAACRVVVLGGGAIGVAAALVARHFGAHDITIGETNALRRAMLAKAEEFAMYEPGQGSEPAENSVDLVIDAVGATATRAAACRMARPGSVIVHLGLLPGVDGLDVRKLTLQEITFTGSYCYTPTDFQQTTNALARRQLGELRWTEQRPLSQGAAAFAAIDAGTTAAAKIVLCPG
jgi:threonine dehydrogenase-like Zn-dependent dehydrogenase